MSFDERETQTAQRAIPLTVITGFLGAGKTTLLNRILGGDHGLRVAVLVNDFGAINIDAELVTNVESDVVSLANGCVCCTIRDDLVDTVLGTIERPERPEYVLLEASGVADPRSIAVTFSNPALRERIRLDGIVCVVDAEQVFSAPELMEPKIAQMACADTIVLNKVDLVDEARVREIESWLDDRFYRYNLVRATRADVPLEILLSAGRFDPARLDTAGAARVLPATQTYSTWSYESARPLSLDALRSALQSLPAPVLRMKGVIYTSEDPQRRAVLHAVGGRVDLSWDGDWADDAQRTRIVAIGIAESVDWTALRRELEAAGSAAPSP